MPNCAQPRDGTLTMAKVNEARAERNERMRLAHQTGMSANQIARHFGVHRTTVGAVLNDRKPPKYDPIAGRIRRLPDQLAAARHKVRALENEARRYGFHDLLENHA